MLLSIDRGKEGILKREIPAPLQAAPAYPFKFQKNIFDIIRYRGPGTLNLRQNDGCIGKKMDIFFCAISEKQTPLRNMSHRIYDCNSIKARYF